MVEPIDRVIYFTDDYAEVIEHEQELQKLIEKYHCTVRAEFNIEILKEEFGTVIRTRVLPEPRADRGIMLSINSRLRKEIEDITRE